MKLAKREKYFVSIAACVIFVFLFLNIAVVPFFEKRSRLKRGIRSMEGEILEMSGLINEYRTLEQSSKKIQELIEGRKSGFTLFSFLETAAGEVNIKDHITYMKPSIAESQGYYKESMVEMQLEAITLAQAAAYIQKIESSKDFIVVKRISIKKNNTKPGYLDLVMQLVTYQI